MSLLVDLRRWKESGTIDESQHAALTALVRRDRFSVYSELTALLYLGVVSVVAGLCWTIQVHFAQLGDVAILVSLTAAFAGALGYCFARGLSYSNALQEQPQFAFDYVLYFGCLVFGVELGFIEYRFHLLNDSWDHYLLLSSMLYFVLAYRFDNRFVLSLALSTLAGWFGLRLMHFGWLTTMSLRPYALGYSALVLASGAAVHRAGIKRHFFETYLHVAVNVALAALVTGIFDRDAWPEYAAGLAALGAVTLLQGLKFERFAFVLYGIAYTYIGLSSALQRQFTFTMRQTMAYDVASGTAVVVLLIVLARRVRRES